MIKVFKYYEELDCFIVDPDYKKTADYLGLTEWNEVVWIGRYFLLDNDVGEHWFDNWDLRSPISERAAALGLDETELFIIDPERFKNDYDGPCHSAQERTLFWKDVLNSLQLSYETLFSEARKFNKRRKELEPDDYITDLEDRISVLQTGNA